MHSLGASDLPPCKRLSRSRHSTRCPTRPQAPACRNQPTRSPMPEKLLQTVSCEGRKEFQFCVCVPAFDDWILPLDPTEVAQRREYCLAPTGTWLVLAIQDTDAANLGRVLRHGRQRDCDEIRGHDTNECSSIHHRIAFIDERRSSHPTPAAGVEGRRRVTAHGRTERLRVFRSCPLITPEDARSSLPMLAIARAMAALCASIVRLLARCSGTLEKLSAAETKARPDNGGSGPVDRAGGKRLFGISPVSLLTFLRPLEVS